MGSEEAAPAQTAVVEAAWFLGNLAGLNDGTENRGLSDVRIGNRLLNVSVKIARACVPQGICTCRRTWSGAS